MAVLGVKRLRVDMKRLAGGLEGTSDSQLPPVDRNQEQFPCNLCHRVFEAARGLRMHTRAAHHEEEVEQCAVCGKEFTEPGLLAAHTAHTAAHVHPFACSLQRCDRTFAQLAHLASHRAALHPDPRPHRCPDCCMCFSRPASLARHSTLGYCRPAAARTLTAACCGLAFSRPDLLALHQTARPGPGLACPSSPALARHQETHGGRLLCPQPACEAEFELGAELTAHLASAHGGTGHVCRACGAQFGAALEMLVHRLGCEDRPAADPAVCAACGRTFEAARFLQFHLAASPACRPAQGLTSPACRPAQGLTCDSPGCGKAFGKPVLLRNHLYSHTDSPFHCRQPGCQLSFVQLELYRAHCRADHHGRLDLIPCDGCSDVFTVQSHLDSHRENVHKEVSYDLAIFEDSRQEGHIDCPFCGEAFPAKEVLRVHLVSLHPPPWACILCGQAFGSLLEARGHVCPAGGEDAATKEIMQDEMDVNVKEDPEEGNANKGIVVEGESIKNPDGPVKCDRKRKITATLKENTGEDINDTIEEDVMPEVADGVVIPDGNFTHDDIAVTESADKLAQVKLEQLEEEELEDPALEAAARVAEATRLQRDLLARPGCPAIGDFARCFGISANSIQLMVIPELLEPGAETSVSQGLALDLLELATAHGLPLHRLVLFLRELTPPSLRPELTAEVTERAAARLGRVRVQASRFRARYAQLPTYLDTYLAEPFHPFV